MGDNTGQRMRLFKSNPPYSQAEIAEQIRQVNALQTQEKDIASEILRFMLDANVMYLKGK